MLKKTIWSELPWEVMNPLLSRRYVSAEKLMVAQVSLKAGCVVPAHQHANEQVSFVLSGSLRFWAGDDVNSEDPADSVLVAGGEVLPIPGNVPHRVVAMEDSLVIDIFAPPREDWLSGADAYLRQR